MSGSLGVFIRSRHPTREFKYLEKTLFVLSAIGTEMRIYAGKQ